MSKRAQLVGYDITTGQSIMLKHNQSFSLLPSPITPEPGNAYSGHGRHDPRQSGSFTDKATIIGYLTDKKGNLLTNKPITIPRGDVFGLRLPPPPPPPPPPIIPPTDTTATLTGTGSAAATGTDQATAQKAGAAPWTRYALIAGAGLVALWLYRRFAK